MEVHKSEIKSEVALAVESVLCMKGGNGEFSYAKNSSLQLKIIEDLIPIMESSIKEKMRLKFRRGETFRIADFGCGSGKNTVVVVEAIIRALQCSIEEDDMPEFQVFFNDLPSNDFNSLLRMLPPPPLPHANLACERSYFAAAVSGSHFRSLFPQKSLHFCHSSTSLHWISQIPESVQKTRSRRVYVSSDCEEGMGAAYLQQFDRDLTAFLSGRAREMVDGGCMLISLVGRKGGTKIMEEQGGLGYIARHIECAFEELVTQDIVEKEKWDTFYMPCFGPSLEEVESIVKREGLFDIQNIRMVEGIPLYSITEENRGEPELFGESVANQARAAFEAIIKVHLGSERLMHEFFLRMKKRACIQFEEYIQKKIDSVVVLLIKN